MELDGARALVTGATGGLGAAIARKLHSRGATVVLSGRRGDVLEQLRGELGQGAEVLVADLADRAVADALPAQVGRIDVLVANAALPASGDLTSFDPQQIDRALDVNLRVPIQLARVFAPQMKERGFGHLVFISSISGKIASAGSSLYSATKFGLRGFALGLREDLYDSGVGVTTVFPGFIRDAGMFADSGVDLPFYVRTRTPVQVAKAVARGIEKDKLEIDVAPFGVRVSAKLAAITPGAIATAQRRAGGPELASEIAANQIAKR